MKVSLNNSLCFQMNNRRIGKVNEPGVNGLFYCIGGRKSKR